MNYFSSKSLFLGTIFFSIFSQAHACSNIKVSPITGKYSTNNKTTMLIGNIDIYCKNQTENPIVVNIVFRSTDEQSVGYLYKNGEIIDSSSKKMKVKVLNNSLRNFDKETISFSVGESTQQIRYLMKPLNLKNIESGSYSGFLPFDMEY